MQNSIPWHAPFIQQYHLKKSFFSQLKQRAAPAALIATSYSSASPSSVDTEGLLSPPPFQRVEHDG